MCVKGNTKCAKNITLGVKTGIAAKGCGLDDQSGITPLGPVFAFSVCVLVHYY